MPTTYEPHKRRFRPIDLDDARYEDDRYRRPRDLRLEHFAPVVPDATLTIYLKQSGAERDLLVELDRTRRPTKNQYKFHRYDAFLTAWYQMTDRYRHFRMPWVVFVCPGKEDAMNLMRTADREVTGRLARPGTRPETWRAPARERMLFAAEQDAHDGLPLAWMLPRQPPEYREQSDFWALEGELPTGT